MQSTTQSVTITATEQKNKEAKQDHAQNINANNNNANNNMHIDNANNNNDMEIDEKKQKSLEERTKVQEMLSIFYEALEKGGGARSTLISKLVSKIVGGALHQMNTINRRLHEIVRDARIRPEEREVNEIIVNFASLNQQILM